MRLLKKITHLILAFALLALLSSCAGVSFVNYNPSDAKTDRKTGGVRYYNAAPYLLLWHDGKGGLSSDLVYLPDTSYKVSANPYTIMASNKTTLNFDETYLFFKGASTELDTTKVPKAIISALEKVATSAIGAGFLSAGEGEDSTGVPTPYIFKIVFEEGKILLKGGQADPTIIKLDD